MQKCFGEGDDLFARIGEHHRHATTNCVFVDEAQFLEEEAGLGNSRVSPTGLASPSCATGSGPTSRVVCFLARRLCSPSPTSCGKCEPSAAVVARRPWWSRLGADGKVARQGAQVAIGKDVYISLCRKHWGRGDGPHHA